MALLLFQLMFLLALLIINGEPLRAIFFRRLKLFSDLDFIQVCILNVYVGGLILYAIALLPIGLFNWFAVVCFTLLSIILSVVIHSKTIIRMASFCRIRTFLITNKKTILTYLLVFLMVVIFLFINLSSLSGLVFGSVRDESVHSLYVQAIIENHSIPVTLQPYLPEGIIYPQASHVLFAFSAYVLNMEVPTAVLTVSVLFKSLSILGAYFLGRKLGQSVAYSLGLSFVFAFISSWPLNITWGANPFIIGFPLFLVCLGLLFSLYRFHSKNSLAEFIVVGLLFGYAGAMIISYLETLIVITFLVLAWYLFLERANTLRSLGKSAAVFGASLLPLSPFFYRFFAFYPYPGHNIGLPQDFTNWTGQQGYLSQALQWSFDNLSPYTLLKVLIIVPIVSMFILLLVTKQYENIHDNLISVVRFGLFVFTPAMLLSFASFFLPGDFNIVSWGHQGILLSIPIGIFTVVSYIKFAEFVREGNFKPLSKIIRKHSKAALLLTITVLALLISPFLYYRFLADSENLRGAYNVFAVTTQSDYDLMMWMRANLSSTDAVILVHPYGSGLFIPSVSHNKIVFPYTGSSLSSSYQTLVGLLQNNTLNSDAYRIMRYWNISYIFVGTNSVQSNPDSPNWKPELFLGNPNFKLVKNFNSSCLFKVDNYDTSFAFMDDFEFASPGLNLWGNNFLGNGLGSVTTISAGVNGSKSLAISAQVMPKTSGGDFEYRYWVERDVFVSDNSDTTLSFYLNATKGFSGKDTFAVLISNTQKSQTIVITTPNGVYQGYPSATTLDGYHGLFSYNLSKMWQQTFNSSLPHMLVLQLVNYDFDGVPNIAYIDNIAVTSKPVAIS